MKQGEVEWKEHQIYSDGDDEEEEDKDVVFNLFAKKTEFETQEFNFHGLPTIKIRGEFEETSTSTGLGLWTGSDFMAEFLCDHADLVRNKRILELGAGLGLIGMIAYHMGASEVLMTDGDTSVLDNLRYNISENSVRNEEISTERTLDCAQLIWGRELDEFSKENGRYEVIIAAECLYMLPSLKPLWETVQKCLTPSGVFMFVNPNNQVDIDMVLEVASQCGFMWTTIGEAKKKVYLFRLENKPPEDTSS